MIVGVHIPSTSNAKSIVGVLTVEFELGDDMVLVLEKQSRDIVGVWTITNGFSGNFLLTSSSVSEVCKECFVLFTKVVLGMSEPRNKPCGDFGK